jgi:hypothetical protein
MFPGTYPREGMILSRLGELNAGPEMPIFLTNGKPKTGQLMGM